MQKNDVLTRFLAVVGTGLVFLPVLAPVAFSLIQLASRPFFHFDYLMPAELFPVAFAGGGLLVWASIRARSRRAWIAGGLGAAAGLLVGGQTLAVLTGMASGEGKTAAWLLVVVLGTVGVYALALLVITLGGVLLVRDLFKPT